MKIKWIQANTNRQHVPGICPWRNTEGVFLAEGERGPVSDTQEGWEDRKWGEGCGGMD